ncbi:hypothetical protein Vi05172_g3802 [Venturia inaequalis]|nr:hypothetical protein Vi05172_g3802 [Venturia inaequalis]
MFRPKDDPPGKDRPLTNHNVNSKVISSHSTTKVMAPSLHDSAYITSDQQSLDTTGTARNQTGSSQGAAIGNGEFFFEKEIDQSMKTHFDTISALLERLFLEYLRKRCPKFGPLVMELRVLGRSEAEATTRLMVYCPPRCYKRAKKFFKTKDAKELCEPYDKTTPRLKAFVFGCAAELVSGSSQIQACASSDTLSFLTTLCGVPLLSTDTSCGASPTAMRAGTFGGMVKLVHEDHSFAFYGMTAKHAVEDCHQDTDFGDGVEETDWGSDESAHESDSESFDDTQDEDGFLPTNLGAKRHDRSSGPAPDAGLPLPWDFVERTFLGEVADVCRLAKQDLERKMPSHDWALLKLDSTKPNELCTKDCLGVQRTQPLLVTSQPNFQDGLSDPITLISGSHGPQAGELFSSPTRLLLGTSKVFVNAYRLTLNDGYVCNGDSGAWVVHSNSPEVYGFLVARNHFGDAYAVSIIDAFEDIKACTGARMVALPTIEEMRTGYMEEPFKANRSVLLNPGGSCTMDDIGSETSEATLIADPVASIAEQLFASPDVEWCSAPHAPSSDTAKISTSALSSNTAIGWNGLSTENNTMLGHSMEQNTTKTKSSEPRFSGQVASKRKSPKQRLPQLRDAEANLINYGRDVQVSTSLEIRKNKMENTADYRHDELFSPIAISHESEDLCELGDSSDHSNFCSKHNKRSARALSASMNCSTASTNTERLDPVVSGSKYVGKNKKKNRRADKKSTVTKGSGISKSTSAGINQSPENAASPVDQRAVLKRTTDVFAKEWPLAFARYRVYDEEPFVPSRRRTFDEDSSNDGNGISILFRDFDDGMAAFRVDEVESFCSNVSLDVLETGSGPTAGFRRGAWLDDRQCSQESGKSLYRNYENPLTATALYRFLKKPRYNAGTLANAERRLIYIRNLDKDYILALAETAPRHQVHALREAISNHLSRVVSIRILDESSRFFSFQLSLHLPFFEFSSGKVPPDSMMSQTKDSLPSTWLDVSFLGSPLQAKSRNSILHRSQFSLVICGTDDMHWVGYSFVDREFGEEEDLDIGVFPYEGVHEDPIFSDLGGREVLDANCPIQDARLYFLSIFEMRIKRALVEWDALAHLISSSIDRHQGQEYQHLFKRNDSLPLKQRRDFTEKALCFNQGAIPLIAELQQNVSELVMVWNEFKAPNGDSNYFSDVGVEEVEGRRAALTSLRSINQCFDSFDSIQRLLNSCKQRCQSSNDALNLHLASQANVIMDHTTFTTEWTITVFSPIALTIAYFSLPAPLLRATPSLPVFFLVCCGVLLLVRVLFDILGGVEQIWWYKGMQSLVEKVRISKPVARNRRPSQEDIEMDILQV